MALFLAQFQVFLVVWARLSAAIYLAPMFSFPELPDRVKIGTAFAISLAIFPWVSKVLPPMPAETGLFLLVVVKEIAVGAMIGFFEAVVFAAFTASTQLFAAQLGIGMASLFDPVTQEEQPVLSAMFYTVAALVFVGIGGLHMVLRAVVDSYRMIPAIDLLAGQKPLLEVGVKYMGMLFASALQFAFPMLAAGTLMTVALGMLSKAAPQFNILVFGLPLQYGVGLLVLLIALPGMVHLLTGLFEYATSDAVQSLRFLRAAP